MTNTIHTLRPVRALARLAVVSALAVAALTGCASTPTPTAAPVTAGEVVTITIHNSGPGDVEFLAYPLYMIINSMTGNVIFGWDRVAQSTIFPAGHTEQFTRDTSLVPDGLGQYAITLNLHFGWDVWTSYRLRSTVDIESMAWGGIKALYQ